MVIRNVAFLLALSFIPTLGSAATEEPAKSGPAARMEIGPATVGEPTQVHWHLSDPKSGKKLGARLSLTITQPEKGTEIFSIGKIPADGAFAMSFQFTDGSAHQVRSVAEMAGQEPIVEEKAITVTAVEPPAKAILPALIFFLAVVASGLAVGRFSRRRAS
ncbi:MAG: hypothetical protein ACREP8_02170 [Candidatus Binatia bacterium]